MRLCLHERVHVKMSVQVVQVQQSVKMSAECCQTGVRLVQVRVMGVRNLSDSFRMRVRVVLSAGAA